MTRKAPLADKPAKGGRPSKRTPEIIAAICKRLSKGEPLAAICRDESMPDPANVWRWQQEDEELSQAIARAREAGEEAIAADCLLIADDARNDFMASVVDEEGKATGLAYNSEHVQRSKLRIETRLKLLSKWNPRKWGDRLQHANDPDNPMPAPQFIVQPVKARDG